MTTLAERLAASRNREFVGRERYVAEFKQLIAADSQAVLFYIHGLGGVGKSTLLNHFSNIAKSAAIEVSILDARTLPADPNVIAAAIHAFTAASPNSDRPRLLLVDSFEYWQALETWFRSELLPQLADSVRIVLVGRQPPSQEWQLDVGWRPLMAVQELTLFSADEARRYLAHRAIAAERIDEVVQHSRQHPLALAMAADALELEPNAVLQQGLGRRLTQQVVERLTSNCHSNGQLQALFIAAVAAETNPSLLSMLLPKEDSNALYRWLQQQSFMRPGADGLFPHDLVRDLLLGNLLNQQPATYQEWARSIFNRQFNAVQSLPGQSAEQAMSFASAGMFALRALPALQGFLATNMGTEIYFDRAHSEDVAKVKAAVLRHEGPQSQALFELWHDAQPQALMIVRDHLGQAVGFALHLELQLSSAAERQQDPAIAALWERLETAGPLQQEVVRCCRFWMDLEQHQQPSPIATAVQNSCVAHVMTDQRLQCMSMVARADVDYWIKFAELADIDTPSDFVLSIDDHKLQLFLNDWRGDKRVDWVRAFADRVTGTTASNHRTPLGSGSLEPVAVEEDQPLDHDLFREYALAALKDFHRTDKLEANPLLKSKLVTSKLGDTDNLAARLKALRSVICQVNDELAENATTQVYSRLITRSYIRPARSQQLAADAMGMGYSTYRRQRDKARDLLVAELWQYER